MMGQDADFDEGIGDLLSPLTETDFPALLLRDLHDDLSGRITRLRFLSDQVGTLGPSGTMLFGGTTSYTVFSEARSSFINGNYAATVILCQALAENLLAGVLGIDGADLPKRISFGETLRRCEQKGYITSSERADLAKLTHLRNPLTHHRDFSDPSHIDRRAMNERERYQSILEKDAFFSIALMMRLLSKRPFRVG